MFLYARHRCSPAASSAVLLVLCLLLLIPSVRTAMAYSAAEEDSGLIDLYDTGIPSSVTVEWSFPTGFSLCIDGGHQLRSAQEKPLSSDSAPRMNLFPLSILVKYSLYHTQKFTQSIGLGFGPYFLYRGPVPIQFHDLELTCSSTVITEWMTRLTQDLSLNLKLKYTHVFQSMVDRIPLEDLTTWLGVLVRW